VAGGIDASAAARHSLLASYAGLSRRVRDDLALMLGEVVTNAVLHGGVGVEERVRIGVVEHGATMTFSVYDPGPGFVPEPPDRRHAAGGWGLLIVDRLARRWGVAREDGQTRVWFEVGVA
jgi:anti-sigma regulatory factor (Ser/Thr protein kinase)